MVLATSVPDWTICVGEEPLYVFTFSCPLSIYKSTFALSDVGAIRTMCCVADGFAVLKTAIIENDENHGSVGKSTLLVIPSNFPAYVWYPISVFS